MLIKFCKPEHNLKTGCKSIRLGTLEYYRNLDSKLPISDIKEGKYSYELLNVSLPSRHDNVNKIFEGMGLNNVNIKNITLERAVANCFVWCCSFIDELPDDSFSNQFDTSYTSFYEIKDANQFAHEVTTLIAKNIDKVKVKNECLNQFKGQPIDLGIITFHGPVVYKKTKSGLVDEFGGLQDDAPNVPIELQPVFIKPIQYSENREYRFIFVLHAINHKCDLDINSEPLDLIIDDEFLTSILF